MSLASAAAKALPWLEFWAKALPHVMDAVQALYRKTGGDPDKAIPELRKVQDQWGNTDAENDEFRARLDAVEAEDKPAAAPEPKVLDGEPYDRNEPQADQPWPVEPQPAPEPER